MEQAPPAQTGLPLHAPQYMGEEVADGRKVTHTPHGFIMQNEEEGCFLAWGLECAPYPFERLYQV